MSCAAVARWSTVRRRSPRPRSRAHRPVWAHNLRTHEITTLTGPGRGTPEARDRFFRCWFTHHYADVPEELIEHVVASARHFEAREVRVISGFRHPKYNLSLRKKGRQVAAKSQHVEGKAIDFFLPGIATRALYDHLLQTHTGGVGYYPVSEFVHIDLGAKRTWRGT